MSDHPVTPLNPSVYEQVMLINQVAWQACQAWSKLERGTRARLEEIPASRECLGGATEGIRLRGVISRENMEHFVVPPSSSDHDVAIVVVIKNPDNHQVKGCVCLSDAALKGIKPFEAKRLVKKLAAVGHPHYQVSD